MIAPAYSDPVPRSTAHLTRKARPIARTSDRAERLELRERLLEQQQSAEDEEEDPDPWQAGPAGVVRTPFPVIDADRAGRPAPAAAVGPEPRHRFLLVVVHRRPPWPSIRARDRRG